MKKFLIKISGFLLFVLSIVFMLILLQSKLIKFLPNDFKRHTVIAEVLNNKSIQPDLIVFGDSRAMFGINTKFLEEKLTDKPICINLTSVGQNMQESVYLFPDIPSSVSLIIHCLDFTTFANNQTTINDAKALSLLLNGFELTHELESLVDPHPFFYRSKLTNLYDSRTFLRSSIHVKLRDLLDKEEFITENYYDLKHPYIYKEERHPNYPNKYKPKKLDKLPLSKKKIELAKRLHINFAKKNVDYIIVLMPLNPDVNEFKKIDMTYLKKLRKAVPEIKIIDFSTNLKADFFYDGIHPNRIGAEVLSKNLADSLFNSSNTKF
ncbi:MAG: hypothetical protein RQ875_08120 [Vicingaceae bacterium]|nr:hypothetical protein [Vicingaceae bacterium]